MSLMFLPRRHIYNIFRRSLSTDWKITYRVTTEWRAIVGNDSKVGDHESRIRMLVFDFERASDSPTHIQITTLTSDGW